MPIRLFHRATKKGASCIPREGFRDGEDGFVWFSRYLDDWGAQGAHPIEVLIDMTEDQLSAFAEEWVSDEEWDEQLGDFVKVAEGEPVERFTWYKIPSAIVNPLSTLRVIGPDEAWRLQFDIEYGED